MTSRNGFTSKMVADALTFLAQAGAEADAHFGGDHRSPEEQPQMAAAVGAAASYAFAQAIDQARKGAALALAAQRIAGSPAYLTVENTDAMMRAFFDPFCAVLYTLAGADIPYDMRAALPVIPKPKHEPETRRSN